MSPKSIVIFCAIIIAILIGLFSDSLEDYQQRCVSKGGTLIPSNAIFTCSVK